MNKFGRAWRKIELAKVGTVGRPFHVDKEESFHSFPHISSSLQKERDCLVTPRFFFIVIPSNAKHWVPWDRCVHCFCFKQHGISFLPEH